jgi:hypothetical protein
MAVVGFENLDFDDFHRGELPRRLAGGHGSLAAAAVRKLGSLAFRLPGGRAYTYAPVDAGVAIIAGDEKADTVIELDHASWEGLVHDYESAPGLLYGGRVQCRRGRAMRFVGWEPGLRAMYAGRPVYDPGSLHLADRQGRPLDLERTFRLDDDRADMAHFLRSAGYLLVRRAFRPDEIAGFLAEARELRGEAVQGDKLSWWGKNSRGDEVLCRVTRAADKPRLATLRSDPRLRSLADLSDQKLVPRDGEGNGVTVIYKNPDMVEGLSNIPWHRDCGMGGHSVMCPVLLISVFLTPASPETGDLRFLPGSWRTTCGFMEATDPSAPQGVRVAAEPGDLSLHYGDVMHAAPPPTRSDLESYRISAITGYARPEARNHRGARSYNDVLHQREDGQVEHLAKVAERA